MDSSRYINLGDGVYLDRRGPRRLTRAEVLAVVTIALVATVLANGIYSIWARGRDSSYRQVCASNLKQLGLAMAQYAQDYNERLPPVNLGSAAMNDMGKLYLSGPAFGWADVLAPYVGETNQPFFHCPAANTGYSQATLVIESGYTDYYYNRNLSALSQTKLTEPAQTILLGDGNDGTDQTDARYSLAALPPSWFTDTRKPSFRHGGRCEYAFCDMHVESFTPDEVRSGVWPHFAVQPTPPPPKIVPAPDFSKRATP